MKSILSLLMLALLPSHLLWGQNPPTSNKTAKDWATQVEKFGKGLPQEKVFLHIDNTCYFVGDTIWYKGYVTRTDRNTLTDLSRILYVELFTPDGYLVERQQLKLQNGTAYGAFKLQDSLYAGYYELRAYTRWMLNFGVTERKHAWWSEGMFYNKSMAAAFFRDYDKLYSRVFPVFNKPEKEGEYIKNMTVRPLQRYFKTKEGKPELSIRFYPEGGRLIAGHPCRVAFEANTAEGEHLKNITLSIVEDKKQIVTTAPVIHRGRGSFIIPEVKAGCKYKATLEYNGYQYDINLPETETEGCNMQITSTPQTLVADIYAGMLSDTQNQMGIQVMHQGITVAYQDITVANGGTAHVEIPIDQLPTGVNQVTLFDNNGRIYADRLYFVNHHDYDAPLLTVEGIEKQYEPFAPIQLKLRLTPEATNQTNLSLSVRDHASDERIYDNGNMLTEMLLSSELKGFVEAPAYYFERDDSTHRAALDLLMMVQGWRRYNWQEMAGVQKFNLMWLPEKNQTIAGCVNKTISLDVDPEYDTDRIWEERDEILSSTLSHEEQSNNSGNPYTESESVYQPANQSKNPDIPNPNSRKGAQTLQERYGTQIGNLKKEVNVLATYTQNTDIVERMQKTLNGTFYMETPVFYDKCILFLSAADTTLTVEEIAKRQQKDFQDEESYPDYYVKLNRFYPVFVQPYSFYHDAMPLISDENPNMSNNNTFSDRVLNNVTIGNKRHGLRAVDFSKPAMVIDAYEAFNLTADYGLNAGTYDWQNFSRQFAMAFVSDMGMDRQYFIQDRYNGKAVNFRNSSTTSNKHQDGINIETIKIPEVLKGGKAYIDAFHKLKNLDVIKLYTSYAPREHGSKQYSQSNQPDIIIDYQRFADDAYQPTYRDRRYILKGFNVCEDFYNPDYSQKPLPDTKDYRRTLYWNPNVQFNENGEADILFYNNAKKTVISLNAEGLTPDGHPVTAEYNDFHP